MYAKSVGEFDNRREAKVLLTFLIFLNVTVIYVAPIREVAEGKFPILPQPAQALAELNFCLDFVLRFH